MISPAAVQMGDFDGDGRIDILSYQTSSTRDPYCHSAPTNNCHLDTTQFWRYIFGPNGLVGTSSSIESTGAYVPSSRTLSDLNGDGVADLMFEGQVF